MRIIVNVGSFPALSKDDRVAIPEFTGGKSAEIIRFMGLESKEPDDVGIIVGDYRFKPGDRIVKLNFKDGSSDVAHTRSDESHGDELLFHLCNGRISFYDKEMSGETGRSL